MTNRPLNPRNTNRSSDPPVQIFISRRNRTRHTTTVGFEATNTMLPCRYCAFLRLWKVVYSKPLPSSTKRAVTFRHVRPDASSYRHIPSNVTTAIVAITMRQYPWCRTP